MSSFYSAGPLTDAMTLEKCKNECASDPDCIKFNYYGRKK